MFNDLKNFLMAILAFYSKYFTWSVIVFSFLTVIFSIAYIDLDSMYYAKFNESLTLAWGDSPKKILDLSDLKLAIFLVGFSLFLFLTVSSYFDKIKDAVVLFVSSFLIKTWLLIYTSGTLILNLGFIKIFRGMTEAEKQAFVDSLKDNMIQYFEELPLEIQKIANPEIFKETTINYLNSLKNVIPSETVATPDILSTFGYYLWDNKFSIFFGILNILVLAALNSKIENTATKLDKYTASNDQNMTTVNSTLKNTEESLTNHHAQIVLLADNDNKLNASIAQLTKLINFNEQPSLEFNNMSELYILNWFILILKKLLVNKKN